MAQTHISDSKSENKILTRVVSPKSLLGLNIVEFAGDDEALIDERVNALCVRLDELIASQQAEIGRAHV